MAIHTKPTGFSSVPPDGPAIPVVDTQISNSKISLQPSAIAQATSWLTAPYRAIKFGSTPAILVLSALL